VGHRGGLQFSASPSRYLPGTGGCLDISHSWWSLATLNISFPLPSIQVDPHPPYSSIWAKSRYGRQATRDHEAPPV
jgi:hypothetical protein